jgi:hypothetical protein
MRKILAKVARCSHVRGMAIIGYARVSTDVQSLDSQNAALKAAGAVRIYRESASGAKPLRCGIEEKTHSDNGGWPNGRNGREVALWQRS